MAGDSSRQRRRKKIKLDGEALAGFGHDALSGEEGLRACDVDLAPRRGVSRTVETLRQLRYELRAQA